MANCINRLQCLLSAILQGITFFFVDCIMSVLTQLIKFAMVLGLACYLCILFFQLCESANLGSGAISIDPEFHESHRNSILSMGRKGSKDETRKSLLDDNAKKSPRESRKSLTERKSATDADKTASSTEGKSLNETGNTDTDANARKSISERKSLTDGKNASISGTERKSISEGRKSIEAKKASGIEQPPPEADKPSSSRPSSSNARKSITENVGNIKDQPSEVIAEHIASSKPSVASNIQKPPEDKLEEKQENKENQENKEKKDE
ncbi:uncharacterized protein LOC119672087 [Teleopsis dalmanni]|uniref:uncharacterized protein LOC119669035 n=1 Tax=Teleopsis dalmanni TaxID=139649 RepID=UPI0018CD6808|nr:uncharacterized protein LOC119669035 [Teleopsis dalmanni]XP_037938974.1 uncharacterized protein LOC119672087 [Teleopsis dalmanni]